MTIPDLNVRPFEPADAEAAVELGKSLGLSQWTVADYRDELRRADAGMLAAVKGANVVGFIVGRRVPGSTHGRVDAEIYNIGVNPRFQRSGTGSALMLEFLSQCREAGVRDVWLEVRATNEVAVRFYRKFGFAPYAVRPGFYRDPPEDGVVMRLTLS